MTNWRASAACSGLPTDDFYPPIGEPGVPILAALTCARCPVTELCLAEGLESPEPFGICGGVRLDQPTLAAHTTDAAATRVNAYLTANPDLALAARVISNHLGISIQATRKALRQLVDDGTIDHLPNNNPRPDLYQATSTPTATIHHHQPRRVRLRRIRPCAGQLTLDLELLESA